LNPKILNAQYAKIKYNQIRLLYAFFQNCASLDVRKKLLTGLLKKASESIMSKCHASIPFIQIQVTFGLSIKKLHGLD
jgi:hypothetical protein